MFTHCIRQDVGTFRQRQGQRCPRGGLIKKQLWATPTEQTDDSQQGQAHLTTHANTLDLSECDCELRRNLENNLSTSTQNPFSVCTFQKV